MHNWWNTKRKKSNIRERPHRTQETAVTVQGFPRDHRALKIDKGWKKKRSTFKWQKEGNDGMKLILESNTSKNITRKLHLRTSPEP